MDSQLADGVSLLNLCSPASSEIALKKKKRTLLCITCHKQCTHITNPLFSPKKYHK